MPVFEYVARNLKGERVSGTLAAVTSQAAVMELEGKSLVPVSVREQAAGRGGLMVVGPAGGRERPVRASPRTLATFYRQLGELLHSGVPILRSLQLLTRGKSRPRLAAVIARVAEDVAKGEGLAESMEKHPRTFPSVQIAMVRAGERGGFLEEVLLRLAAFLQKQADVRSTLVASLIYPIVLVVAGVAVVTGVMVIFVPKFKAMLEGIDLPLPTRVVLGASDLLSEHGLLIGGGAAALVAALAWAWRRPGFHAWWSRVALRLWVIGPLARSMAVARFCRVLGTLLGNGIPMLQAMEISKNAAGNAVMVAAIDKAAASVRAGETLADPLAQSGLFDEEVIEIVRIGESANNLDDVLVGIADTTESRIDRMLAAGVRLVEPLLLLALGVILMFIILALVVPLVMLSANAGRA